MFISESSVGTDFESFWKCYRVQHGKVMKQWTIKMNIEQWTMSSQELKSYIFATKYCRPLTFAVNCVGLKNLFEISKIYTIRLQKFRD